MKKHTPVFYDLEFESASKAKEEQERYQSEQILSEMRQIREATQAICAMMMSMSINGGFRA